MYVHTRYHLWSICHDPRKGRMERIDVEIGPEVETAKDKQKQEHEAKNVKTEGQRRVGVGIRYSSINSRSMQVRIQLSRFNSISVRVPIHGYDSSPYGCILFGFLLMPPSPSIFTQEYDSEVRGLGRLQFSPVRIIVVLSNVLARVSFSVFVDSSCPFILSRLDIRDQLSLMFLILLLFL